MEQTAATIHVMLLRAQFRDIRDEISQENSLDVPGPGIIRRINVCVNLSLRVLNGRVGSGQDDVS
jgi:hypothetical protein